MKKICLAALILLAACKKPGDGDSISTVNIQVKDATSGQPVSGALVSLYRCANLGCAWGTVEEFRGTTDNDGICAVPSANYNNVPVWNDAIYVVKENYQTQFFSKSTTVSIKPYGWMAVKIARGSNYPQGAQLIFLVEETGQSNYLEAQRFDANTDSTIILKGYGNQQNQINWQVSNSAVLNSGMWNQQVPRLDTVKNITLNY
jgi:5-hydroxyisourate hydrolase-like protein (transthyretin family)